MVTKYEWQPTERARKALHGWAGFQASVPGQRHEVSSSASVTELKEIATGTVIARLPGPSSLARHPTKPIWADGCWHVVLEP